MKLTGSAIFVTPLVKLMYGTDVHCIVKYEYWKSLFIENKFKFNIKYKMN